MLFLLLSPKPLSCSIAPWTPISPYGNTGMRIKKGKGLVSITLQGLFYVVTEVFMGRYTWVSHRLRNIERYPLLLHTTHKVLYNGSKAMGMTLSLNTETENSVAFPFIRVDEERMRSMGILDKLMRSKGEQVVD